jgi:hypothetical protein
MKGFHNFFSIEQFESKSPAFYLAASFSLTAFVFRLLNNKEPMHEKHTTVITGTAKGNAINI